MKMLSINPLIFNALLNRKVLFFNSSPKKRLLLMVYWQNEEID